MNSNLHYLILILIIPAIVILTGCVTSPVVGILYTGVDHGTNVGDGSLETPKEGRACAHGVLGLVAFGDASIKTAKANGNITKIAYVDHHSLSVYFFYVRYCTIVRGV